eukprot:766692-Hanusia_phi.AAC.3
MNKYLTGVESEHLQSHSKHTRRRCKWPGDQIQWPDGILRSNESFRKGKGTQLSFQRCRKNATTI